MKPRVRIYIEESDSYFNLGMRHALTEYFSRQGRIVDFVGNDREGLGIDLAVWTPENETGRLSTVFLPPSITQAKLLVVLKGNNKQHFSDCAKCFFFRHQSKNDLAKLLDGILHVKSHQDFIKRKLNERNESLLTRLTNQQREVIYHLALGMGLKDIAKKLDIEYKTASNHKRKIMMRLDLKKNNQLYDWLRERMISY